MSRVGKLPVAIPQGVTVDLGKTQITAKGKLGELKTPLTGDVTVTMDKGEIWVKPANDTQHARAMWGTTRNNIVNLVKGVTDGFSKTLELNGVGFRASVKGKILQMTLGFSHEIMYAIPDGITMKVENQNLVTVSGPDKQKVGKVAADIRSLRKPGNYALKGGSKTKGVRYQGEFVLVKEGKKK